tara:strand:- start:178 stop:753 length:576 start_codon:yes stop_codon:yes gene_type:complete
MTASYGTVKQEYGKQWIYLNPNPAVGPFAWNVANLPEVDDPTIIDDIENLYTVAPIMNNQIGQQANLYFSIEDCKARELPDGASGRTLASNIALLLDGGNLPPTSRNGLFDLNGIEAEAPVMARQNDKDAYLWFDISGLDHVNIDKVRRYKVKAGYNSRSVTSLTADIPLAVDASDGLATVSFDITTLPDA